MAYEPPQIYIIVMIDDEHQMISSGFANMTPLHAPRDIPDEDLALFIETMASQNRMGEAIKAMEDSVRKEPNRADLHVALGNLYLRAERYDEALATL